MKKEIKTLLDKESGEYRINNICTLKRLKKDIVGNDIDKLTLVFDTINDVDFSHRSGNNIKSRDYDGIIEECQKYISAFLQSVALDLCMDLKAGYRNKE